MLLNLDRDRSDAVEALAFAPSMVPVTFADCSGWFHSPETGNGCDIAVLLCPGVGQDGSAGYRSLRLLADEFAKEGYPTLRFDYPCTGDSRDTDPSDHWATWQNSINHALNWLRASTGAHRLVLAGLRIGATLAAVVAEQRRDVAGLILLAPVLRGKTYIGQLAMEARIRGHGPTDENEGMVLDDLLLSDETQRRMRLVDLRHSNLPAGCRHLLVHAVEQSPVLAECLAVWRSRNFDVTLDTFAGLEALLRPANFADEPAADFRATVAWLRREIPRHLMPPPVDPVPPYLGMQVDGGVETAIRFGEADHLCGVLCRPAKDHDPDYAVIITNSGGNPHHGFARFSVRFARILARGGVASLRIDFAGLGDSRTSAADDGPTHVFDADRTGDMREAADALERWGYHRFAVHGVCSGAYHALHAALADNRFDTLLLVNLPWFTLRYEKAGQSSFARHAVASLTERDVRTQFLFAKDDPGIKQLERHFGPNGNDLQAGPSAVVRVFPDWDHDLTDRGMQDAAGDVMLTFLRCAGRPDSVNCRDAAPTNAAGAGPRQLVYHATRSAQVTAEAKAAPDQSPAKMSAHD